MQDLDGHDTAPSWAGLTRTGSSPRPAGRVAELPLDGGEVALWVRRWRRAPAALTPWQWRLWHLAVADGVAAMLGKSRLPFTSTQWDPG